jgi:hypothetical protein
MIAHSASNCVADLPIGIDKDFFRSLVNMRTGELQNFRDSQLWFEVSNSSMAPEARSKSSIFRYFAGGYGISHFVP